MRKLDVAFIYHLLAWTSACHASSSSSWRWHSHSHAVHTQGPTSNRAADEISSDVQPPLMYINVKQQHSSPPSITTVPVCSCTQPPAGLVSRNRLEEWCKNEGRDDKESAPGSSFLKFNRKPGLNNPKNQTNQTGQVSVARGEAAGIFHLLLQSRENQGKWTEPNKSWYILSCTQQGPPVWYHFHMHISRSWSDNFALNLVQHHKCFQ